MSTGRGALCSWNSSIGSARICRAIHGNPQPTETGSSHRLTSATRSIVWASPELHDQRLIAPASDRAPGEEDDKAIDRDGIDWMIERPRRPDSARLSGRHHQPEAHGRGHDKEVPGEQPRIVGERGRRERNRRPHRLPDVVARGCRVHAPSLPATRAAAMLQSFIRVSAIGAARSGRPGPIDGGISRALGRRRRRCLDCGHADLLNCLDPSCFDVGDIL